MATIADWQFQIGEPFLIKGGSELPQIQNSSERRSFRKENIMALVIPYRIRNNAPVARKRDVSFQFKDTLGETRDYGPYNAEQWGLILDVKSSWDLGKIPPNQWIDTVTVVAADPEGVDGAAIYLRMQETRRYSTGKKYKTTKAQTLIELPPVSRKEGPPRGSKSPWMSHKQVERLGLRPHLISLIPHDSSNGRRTCRPSRDLQHYEGSFTAEIFEDTMPITAGNF